MLLQFDRKHLSNKKIDMVKQFINKTLILTSNILDFEKILTDKYIIKKYIVNPLEIIKNICQNTYGSVVHIYYPDNIFQIEVDKLKFSEIFLNGYTNSLKHCHDKKIYVYMYLENNRIFIRIIFQG